MEMAGLDSVFWACVRSFHSLRNMVVAPSAVVKYRRKGGDVVVRQLHSWWMAMTPERALVVAGKFGEGTGASFAGLQFVNRWCLLLPFLEKCFVVFFGRCWL